MAQTKRKPGRPPGSKNKNTKTTASKSSKPAKSAKSAKKETKAAAKADVKAMQEKRKADQRVIDEIWGVIFIAIGIFLFAAVQFHAAGELGNTIGDVLKGVFGLIGLVVPWYLMAFGALTFADKTVHISAYSVSLCFMILLMMCLLNSGRFIDENALVYQFAEFYEKGVTLENGGFFGMTAGTFLVKTRLLHITDSDFRYNKGEKVQCPENIRLSIPEISVSWLTSTPVRLPRLKESFFIPVKLTV